MYSFALFVFFFFSRKAFQNKHERDSLVSLNLTADWKIRVKFELMRLFLDYLPFFFFFSATDKNTLGTLDMNYSKSVHIVFFFFFYSFEMRLYRNFADG